ncbi:hypothetical protein [Sphaerisporangium dianthi]|uniref:Uncharacterized protein n=1 Tax=Sphaerisporangium dianthi TaxID=1436120 RepID=A0ABV9CRS6_9ACTN
MADRSVSISLRAKVGDFVTNMRTAKASTQDLSRQMTETGASADRMRQRLEAATKALPKIKIDADSSAAEVKFAQLRRDLESLAGKRIGIDIDAGAAIAETQRIERELEQLQRTEVDVSVRADIGTALAELRAMQGEVNRLDGETARVKVDADVSGALANIALVGAALSALPAAVTIGAGVASLGSAFGVAAAGAAAFGAVAIPAMGRVSDAVKEMGKATGGAGGSTKSLAQSQAEAAARALQLAQAQDRVKDALRKVKDAQTDVTRAQRDLGAAQADVSRAIEDAASRHADALRRIADAERSLGDAQRDALRAQQAVNDARREAARDLEDLGNRLIDTNLDLKGAQLDLTDAQDALNKVMADPKATAAQKERAQLNYDRAVQRVKELQLALERLNAEQAQADKDGVEGSKRVKDAKDALSQANERIADAQRNLADAQRDAAKVDLDNARRIADAQQKVVEAHEKVAEAQRKVADAQRDAIRAAQRLRVEQLQAKAAMNQAGGAAGGAASKFGELSKAEQGMAKDLKKFQDGYKTWQQSLEGDVFPAIKGGLDLVTTGLPKISPLVKTASKSFVGLEKDARKALTDPFWDKFIRDIDKEMPGAIEGLGHTAGNVFKGIAGVIDAVLPHSGDLIGAIEGGSKKFADWGVKLRDNPDFKAFVAWVKTNAPEVAHLLGSVATSAGHIVTALTPFVPSTLGGMQLLANITAGMSPSQIQGIALAVAAIYTAVKVGKAVSSGVELLGDLRTKIGEAGSAAGSNKGKISAFAGLLGAGGPWGLAVGAGITALGLFAGAHEEAKRKVDDLARSLDQTTGKITGESREAAKKELFDSGAVEAAKRMGINLKDLTEAALGNEAAIKRVNKVLDDNKTYAQVAGGRLGTYSGTTKILTGDAKLLNDVIGGQNERLNEARQKTADAAAMGGVNIETQRRMKDAYTDATRALDESNHKLEVSAGMTDRQKEAVRRAQEAFAGLLGKVKDNANATYTLTGKTSDATEAIARQLPKLFDLAGKSKEAREQIYQLAEKYGISRKEADKASEGGKKLKEVLDKLKSKDIHIKMDTSAAEKKLKALYDWQLKILGVNNKIPEGIAAPKKKADGGVSFAPFAAGGVAAFAGGAERHVAQIAPAGAMRLWAEPETGGEAYIPLAASKRARSTQILATVAGEFGMQLMPKKLALVAAANGGLVAGSATPVMATGSASGGLRVSIDNLGSLTASLDAASTGLNEQLAGATGRLTDTMGATGTLTKTLGTVGKTADKVATTTAGSTASLTKSITSLTAAISKLTTAISKAGAVAKTTSNAGGSKTSTSKPKANTAPKARTDPNDATYDRHPPPKNRGLLSAEMDDKPRNSVGGSSGGGGGDFFAAAYSPSDAVLRRAGDVLGQAAGSAFGWVMAGSAARSLPINGQPTGWRANDRPAARPVRRSAPVMGGGASYSGVYSAGPVQKGSLAGRLAHDGAAGRSGSLVHVERMEVREQADIDMVAARIAMRVNARG